MVEVHELRYQVDRDPQVGPVYLLCGKPERCVVPIPWKVKIGQRKSIEHEHVFSYVSELRTTGDMGRGALDGKGDGFTVAASYVWTVFGGRRS